MSRHDEQRPWPRKLLAQASRNGWFFVLDRETGRNVLSREYVKTNWARGVDEKGQPVPNPRKEPQVAGALVSPPTTQFVPLRSWKQTGDWSEFAQPFDAPKGATANDPDGISPREKPALL